MRRRLPARKSRVTLPNFRAGSPTGRATPASFRAASATFRVTPASSRVTPAIFRAPPHFPSNACQFPSSRCHLRSNAVHLPSKALHFPSSRRYKSECDRFLNFAGNGVGIGGGISNGDTLAAALSTRISGVAAVSLWVLYRLRLAFCWCQTQFDRRMTNSGLSLAVAFFKLV